MNKRPPDLDHWDSMGVCKLRSFRVDIHQPIDPIPSSMEVAARSADRRSGDTDNDLLTARDLSRMTSLSIIHTLSW